VRPRLCTTDSTYSGHLLLLILVFITIILGPNNLVQDNSGVCVKGSTCSEFEIEYDGKLEGVVELQYHSEHNKVFFI
jgi:hypothetical protein